jgi:hypothetical protein
MGKTFIFKNVEAVRDNESYFQFDYSATSDGKMKTATFRKEAICGWSVTLATQVTPKQ